MPNIEEVPVDYDQEIVLEVRRSGRRPRYHRGARQAGTGVRLDPPQCNLDDVSLEVRVLDALPAILRRPWTQLCRRCFRGRPELVAAIEQGVAQGVPTLRGADVAHMAGRR